MSPSDTWKDTVELVNVHCQGEVGKVIVGGAPEVPGATLLDKMNHINRVDDSLRRFVTLEPRACLRMSVNLLVKPAHCDADAGFIVLQADRAHPMSGSNCICVVTALLETGRVPMSGPETVLRLDTPVGLVVARARCVDGRCESVSLDNAPAFVEALDLGISTARWGVVSVDIAFGGVYYAIVDARQVGLEIAPANARRLAEAGLELHAACKEQVHVFHPTCPGIDEIAYVMFRTRLSDTVVRTCTTLPPGRVDRSPCGTGSSAHLAVLHARGEAVLGHTHVSRSILDGEFRAEIVGVTHVGDRPAILPRITGQAWIYGVESLRKDPQDQFAQGFMLNDA